MYSGPASMSRAETPSATVTTKNASGAPGFRTLLQALSTESLAGSQHMTSELVEVTDEYVTTLSNSIRARDAESAELEDLLGADEFAEGQSSRRQELAAVHDGLLVRYLISAVRP